MRAVGLDPSSSSSSPRWVILRSTRCLSLPPSLWVELYTWFSVWNYGYVDFGFLLCGFWISILWILDFYFIVFFQMHLLIGWPVETCREIFAPSSSSPRSFIGKLGEFINNSNSPCERELVDQVPYQPDHINKMKGENLFTSQSPNSSPGLANRSRWRLRSRVVPPLETPQNNLICLRFD
jgi:hypothetical protein